MAYVPVSPFPYCKLRAHQLTSVLLHAGDVLELSAAFQALAHETQDHTEALDAMLEKRAPVYTGR